MQAGRTRLASARGRILLSASSGRCPLGSPVRSPCHLCSGLVSPLALAGLTHGQLLLRGLPWELLPFKNSFSASVLGVGTMGIWRYVACCYRRFRCYGGTIDTGLTRDGISKTLQTGNVWKSKHCACGY